MPQDHLIEPNYHLVTSDVELRDYCQALSSRPWIVLDTEFIREKTYRPQLCLVQIKSEEILLIVDALAVSNLTPLSEILHDPAITKVLHAATQDLEIFYWLNRKVPEPLFDTQIAAPLLGFNEQIGYGNLVREMLGVELSKAHTRADWSRRPLPEQQLRYAADDVIYLEAIYLQQLEQLNQKNRLQWLTAEFESLADPTRYKKPAKDMWKKIRAAQKLKGPSLAVLQALAEWRELQARESNLPRNWLIKDDLLADLARQMPDSVSELDHIRGLGNRVKSNYAERIVEIINTARLREPEPVPQWSRKLKISPQQNAVIDVLSAYVNFRAAELHINPSQLASRKMLEMCVATGTTEGLSGWRQPLLGESIQSLLDGQSALSIQAGKLSITPHAGH